MTQASSSESPRQPANVYAFVSAKGGTGKSIMAATTAYLLLKCKRKVLAIDADFATRGLSLYLLGHAVDLEDLVFQPRNCLADSFFDQLPVSDIEPRLIVRDLVEFHVLLSNRELYRGGVPDERMLGAASKTGDRVTASAEEFTNYLVRVCDRFRNEYDDIIIDTRGGFDFTSAGPAGAADGYVIVLEADAISRDQVGGLIKKIGEFGVAHLIRPALKGFIVNKALFALDTLFVDELRRLYNAKTFGVIPVDRDAVRAYQQKEIPAEVSPDSDFAYFSMQAVERLASPTNNEWAPNQQQRFEEMKRVIRREWVAQQRLNRALEYLPYAYLVFMATAGVFYAIYRFGRSAGALTGFYVITAVAVFGATTSSLLAAFRGIQRAAISFPLKLAARTVMALTLLVLGYVASTDMPRAFSRDALLSHLQEQDVTLTRLNGQLSEARIAVIDATTKTDILKSELARADAQTEAAQNERDNALQALLTTREQLAAVQSRAPQLPFRSTVRVGLLVGPCTVVVLFNQTQSPISLKGWRLEANSSADRGVARLPQARDASARMVLPLEWENKDIPPFGRTSLFGGSGCERGVAGVLGYSSRFAEQLAVLSSIRDGDLRLLDPAGSVVDSVHFVGAPAAS